MAGQEGVYLVNFEVFDATEAVPIIDNELVQITVTGLNNPPVLNPIGNKTVANTTNLSFTIGGSDPDGDAVSFNAFFLPAGASFNTATKTFSWTPTAAQSNNTYFVTFRATDNGTPNLNDEEIVAITVGAGNQPPVFTTIADQTIQFGQSLTVPVTVTDAVGQRIEVTSQLQPTGSTFTSTPGTSPVSGTFSWTPTLADAGVHTVRLRAEDNGSPILSSIEEFVVTVLVNSPPTANAGGPVYPVFEGDTVSLDGSASTDSDGTIVSCEWDFDFDGNPAHFTADYSSPTPTATFNAGCSMDPRRESWA